MRPRSVVGCLPLSFPPCFRPVPYDTDKRSTSVLPVLSLSLSRFQEVDQPQLAQIGILCTDVSFPESRRTPLSGGKSVPGSSLIRPRRTFPKEKQVNSPEWGPRSSTVLSRVPSESYFPLGPWTRRRGVDTGTCPVKRGVRNHRRGHLDSPTPHLLD